MADNYVEPSSLIPVDDPRNYVGNWQVADPDQEYLRKLWDQAGSDATFVSNGSLSWDQLEPYGGDQVAANRALGDSRYYLDGDENRENDFYIAQNPDGTLRRVPIMRHGWNLEFIKMALPIVTAGASAALNAGATAGGMAAEGVSGMDLAADAAIGSGNNVYTAAGQFAAPAAAGVSGMDLAADAAAGTGNNVYTAGGQFTAPAAAGAGAGGGGNVTSAGVPDGTAFNEAGYTGGTPSLAGGGIGGGGTGMSNGFLGLSTNDWLQLGGSLLNGYLGSRAADKAANAQIDATREGNALLKYMYNQTRADNMPALQARNSGLSGYQNLLANPSKITSDPGYQFGLSQGTKAIGSQAAAKGGYYSGATLKALNQFGQDYGQTKFDQSLNRYGNLAGLGQVGSSQIGQAGANYGNQASQNMIGAGNARGAASMAGSNAWQNALNNFLGYQQYKNTYGG